MNTNNQSCTDEIKVKQDGVQTAFVGIQNGGQTCNLLFKIVQSLQVGYKYYNWNICVKSYAELTFGDGIQITKCLGHELFRKFKMTAMQIFKSIMLNYGTISIHI